MKTFSATIPLGSGPEPVRFKYDAKNRPVDIIKPRTVRYMLTLHLGVVNGRAEVVGMELVSGGRRGQEIRPITGDLLRRIPLGTVAEYVRIVHGTEILRQFYRTASQGAKTRLRTKLTEVKVEARKEPRRGGAPRRYDYAEVAAIYNEAVKLGRPPRKAVREHYGIGSNEAAKLVQRVRLAGHDLG